MPANMKDASCNIKINKKLTFLTSKMHAGINEIGRFSHRGW